MQEQTEQASRYGQVPIVNDPFDKTFEVGPLPFGPRTGFRFHVVAKSKEKSLYDNRIPRQSVFDRLTLR